MTRVLRCASLVALSAVVMIVLAAGPAAAHASLQETTPAADEIAPTAPKAIELEFNEPVDASLGGVRVTAPDGERADTGTASTMDGGRVVRAAVERSGEGTYLVEWSVVSEDGHLLQGSYVYSVGRTSDVAAPSDDGRSFVRALAGVARVVAYAGVLLLVGVLVAAALQVGSTARLGMLGVFASVSAAVGAAVLLLTQTALAAGRPLLDSAGLLDDTLGTRTGALGGMRVAVAGTAVALVLLWRLYRKRVLLWLVAAAVLVLASLPALAGHAWTTSPRALAVAADALHMMVTGAWIGGLAIVLAARDGAVADRLRRFSPVAAWALLATVLTGAGSSWLQTKSVDAATSTGYGRLLLVKVALVALTALAGFGMRRRLGRADSGARLVFGELGLALAVLSITALLVNQPPARDTVDRPISVVADTTGDEAGSIEVQLASSRPGSTDLHVYFFNLSGLPRGVDAVEVTVGRAGQPGRTVKVTPITPEHVTAYDVAFPTAGTWTIAVTALSNGKASSTTVEVLIR
jgi:copper transport protein